MLRLLQVSLNLGHLLSNHVYQGTAVVVQIELAVLYQSAALDPFALVLALLVAARTLRHQLLHLATIVVQELVQALVFRGLRGTEGILRWRHLLEHGVWLIAVHTLVVHPANASILLNAELEVRFVGRVRAAAVDRNQPIMIVAVVCTLYRAVPQLVPGVTIHGELLSGL